MVGEHRRILVAPGLQGGPLGPGPPGHPLRMVLEQHSEIFPATPKAAAYALGGALSGATKHIDAGRGEGLKDGDEARTERPQAIWVADDSPRDGSTRSRVWGSRQLGSRRSGSRQERLVAPDLVPAQLFQVRAVPALADAIAALR